MGITANYRFTKEDCRVCSGEGVVQVPAEVEDVLEFILVGDQDKVDWTDTVEEICPVCDGKGWYYHEWED